MQDESFVHQIEGAVLERVVDDAVAADLDVGSLQSLLQPANVQVGGHHLSRLADACREPAGDRATAGPDLQATPPLGGAETLEMAERDRIEQRGEGAKAIAGLERFIVEEIAGVAHRTPRH